MKQKSEILLPARITCASTNNRSLTKTGSLGFSVKREVSMVIPVPARHRRNHPKNAKMT